MTYQIMRTAAEQARRIRLMGTNAAQEVAMSATDPLVDMLIARCGACMLDYTRGAS
jgi:hypothetical protein